MKHPGEEALAAHVESPDGHITEHVSRCRSCARILSEYQSLTTALADSAAWPERTTEPSGLEGRQTALQDEERSAVAILNRLAATPIATWSAHLPRNVGTVRSLLRYAHGQLEADPKRAYSIADLALRVAGNIPDAEEQRYLCGWAQRERANALRYLGRYQEALRALDEAEEHFAKLPTGEFDLACVFYIRAGLLREQRHFPEARAAATESARIFALFGESVREMHARLVLANIDYDDSKFARAREQYIELLAARALRGDDLTLARVHHNLGSTLQQSGEHAAARDHLTIAQRTYDRMNRHTEAARVQWVLARTALSEGDAGTAENELWIAIAMLTEQGMRVDAALARLDLAELLLDNDDPQGARSHCTAIIDDLLEAGMAVPAASAMDTLRQAATANELTPALLKETRTILQELASS